MATSQQNIGQRGEVLAAAYLEKQGCTIIARNWRCKLGELDIVARDGEIWLFVEVKTVRSGGLESAYAQLTPYKRARLERAVYAYLEAHNLDEVLWRLDAVVVVLPYKGETVIEHAENVFDW